MLELEKGIYLDATTLPKKWDFTDWNDEIPPCILYKQNGEFHQIHGKSVKQMVFQFLLVLL